jgi:hypothetical protein
LKKAVTIQIEYVTAEQSTDIWRFSDIVGIYSERVREITTD